MNDYPVRCSGSRSSSPFVQILENCFKHHTAAPCRSKCLPHSPPSMAPSPSFWAQDVLGEAPTTMQIEIAVEAGASMGPIQTGSPCIHERNQAHQPKSHNRYVIYFDLIMIIQGYSRSSALSEKVTEKAWSTPIASHCKVFSHRSCNMTSGFVPAFLRRTSL